MINPKITQCEECSDILHLIEEIDCMIFQLSKTVYNNIVFMLNLHVNYMSILDLLHYKRILEYKLADEYYICEVSLEAIRGKVRLITLGCKSKCPCDVVSPITTPVATSHCTVWEAHNNNNTTMSTTGYIEFTAIGGGTIDPILSHGVITYYLIAEDGFYPCNIEMTIDGNKLRWDTNTLPVVEDRVLTSLVYTLNIVFTDPSSTFDVEEEQTDAPVFSDQTDAFFDDCN